MRWLFWMHLKQDHCGSYVSALIKSLKCQISRMVSNSNEKVDLYQNKISSNIYLLMFLNYRPWWACKRYCWNGKGTLSAHCYFKVRLHEEVTNFQSIGFSYHNIGMISGIPCLPCFILSKPRSWKLIHAPHIWFTC